MLLFLMEIWALSLPADTRTWIERQSVIDDEVVQPPCHGHTDKYLKDDMLGFGQYRRWKEFAGSVESM